MTESIQKRTVYIDDVIGGAKLNGRHIAFFLILLLTHFVNGYGVNIYSVVVKDMMAEIGMDTVVAGYLGSLVFYGMIIGAMLSGWVATKIGFKKTAIIFCAVNIFTYIVMGTTKSVGVFAVMRTISGVGLSGVMPCTSGTMGEWAPAKSRGFFVTVVTLGTSLGSAFCSMAAIGIMSKIGWRGMFYIEAVILVCILLIAFVIPESLQMLVKKGKNEEIYKSLKKINPQYTEMSADDEFIYRPINTVRKASFIELFKNGYARNTILLFCSKAAIFFTNFGLQTWFTTLMTGMGYSMDEALLSLTIFNFGGMLGMPLIGVLTTKFGFKKSFNPVFIVMAASVAAMGFKFSAAILCVIMFIAGTCVCCIIGGEIAYAQAVFPLPLRPLVLGIVLGLTRIGASLGPTVGGYVLEGASCSTLYFVYAAAVLVSWVCLMFVRDDSKKFDKAFEE